MDKKELILKYFQKKDLLTVKNKDYQNAISSLFQWLIQNDHIENDITSKIIPNIYTTAKIIAGENGVIAGIEEIKYLLRTYTKLAFKPKLSDGEEFKEKETIAVVSGKSHEILGFERTILNILQRMSGIATTTNRLIKSINKQQPIINVQLITNNLPPTTDNRQPNTDYRQPYLAATRKTPWMSLDKKAVAVGGGLTHRLHLSDGILIKDNHLSVEKKVFGFTSEETIIKTIEITLLQKKIGSDKYTSQVAKLSLDSWDGEGISKKPLETGQLIEIEVTNQKQAETAIKTFRQLTTLPAQAGHNSQLTTHNHLAILLDNFTPSQAKTLLRDLSNLYDLSNIIFEASGGINEDNIKDWAKTGVDIISLGSLTHSSHAINLSLEF